MDGHPPLLTLEGEPWASWVVNCCSSVMVVAWDLPVCHRPCNSSFPYHFRHLSQLFLTLLNQGPIFVDTQKTSRRPRAINHEWRADDHRYPRGANYVSMWTFLFSFSSLILMLPDREELVTFDVLYYHYYYFSWAVELDKQSYCDVTVINNSDHHVAFKVHAFFSNNHLVNFIDDLLCITI